MEINYSLYVLRGASPINCTFCRIRITNVINLHGYVDVFTTQGLKRSLTLDFDGAIHFNEAERVHLYVNFLPNAPSTIGSPSSSNHIEWKEVSYISNGMSRL